MARLAPPPPSWFDQSLSRRTQFNRSDSDHMINMLLPIIISIFSGCPVLDALLDAAPDYATQTQQREFQTELLRSLMNHLLAADALLGDQGALAVAAGGTQQNLTLNIFYVAQRVVDKLWQGEF